MTRPQAANPAKKYEKLFVPAIFGPWARVLVERASPRTGDALLDLACGTGIVARTDAPLVGRSGRVTALDLRPGMLAVAKALPPPEGAAIDHFAGQGHIFVTLTIGEIIDVDLDGFSPQNVLQDFWLGPATVRPGKLESEDLEIELDPIYDGDRGRRVRGRPHRDLFPEARAGTARFLPVPSHKL